MEFEKFREIYNKQSQALIGQDASDEVIQEQFKNFNHMSGMMKEEGRIDLCMRDGKVSMDLVFQTKPFSIQAL